jgi:putative Mg2+ transporter-C (MgtC) family protein
MSYLNELIISTEINTGTAVLRLGISFIAGAIIGFERETHHQPAGLKTHILICIGSTLLMLLSIYIPQTYTSFQNGDPGRIAAQVVTGVGFIGAGAILRMGINVKGLTTAASIWAIAAIGLVIGAGMYLPAIISVGLILFVLIIVEQLEKHFFTPITIKVLSLKTTSPDTDRNVQSILQTKHLRIIEINPTFHKGESFGYTYKIGSSNRMEWVELTNQLIKTDPQIFEIEIYDPSY